jgi:hypothetical protein
MAAPSLITTRRFSHSLRLRLQVIFARAWESLAETHCTQAVGFVRRLRAWMPFDEALDRYFREVGVPAAMQDTVRARALIALAPMLAEGPEPEARAAGWSALRPDQMIETLKRRAQYVEEVNLECRLAASLCDEATATTHLRMALETAELLAGEVPPDEAIMHYIRTFNLPSIEAQLVFRRTMAQWAERHSPNAEAWTATVELRVCASAPQLELPSRFRLGLRAAG